MPLAIFDLDNTLLAGDSDHAWGEFACETGIVDAVSFGARNDAFYRDYLAGKLDIDAYQRHALTPLIGQPAAVINEWHRQFMLKKIEPMLLPAAAALLAKHRQQGDTLLIVTATNRFITEPIAARLGVESLLACEAEIVNGCYTGEPQGVPSYAQGKVIRVQEWLNTNGHNLIGSYFYSDSHNDLPLLQTVQHPIAVDPDDILRTAAEQAGWPIISLRD